MLKICKTCVLPDTYPGIKFNIDGVCNYCQNFRGKEALEKQKEKYRQKFQDLLSSRNSSLSNYDVLVAYSGGKDSTYTLVLLKNDYGLRVLAVTFDHGFFSPRGLKNIHAVTEKLGIDHIFFRPNFLLMKRIFRASAYGDFYPRKALERASSICNSCMAMVKFSNLRRALEMHIPLIGYGWSPGQAPIQSSLMKNNPALVRKAQQLFLQPLEKAGGSAVRAYFLEDRHFALSPVNLSRTARSDLRANNPLSNNIFPYNIHPLAFHEYNEQKIMTRIRELDWIAPQDTDANSTNCLLNSFANQIHIKKHGFHPYALEMASLVRNGILSRDEGLRKLSDIGHQEIIASVKRELEITDQSF